MDIVADVAQAIFGGVWSLLLGTEYPGLGVSIASVAVALVLIRFSIRIFGFISGFRGGEGSVGRATDAAEKAKIEYDRRHRNKIGF